MVLHGESGSRIEVWTPSFQLNGSVRSGMAADRYLYEAHVPGAATQSLPRNVRQAVAKVSPLSLTVRHALPLELWQPSMGREYCTPSPHSMQMQHGQSGQSTPSLQQQQLVLVAGRPIGPSRSELPDGPRMSGMVRFPPVLTASQGQLSRLTSLVVLVVEVAPTPITTPATLRESVMIDRCTVMRRTLPTIA